jgi:hypothetical protein
VHLVIDKIGVGGNNVVMRKQNFQPYQSKGVVMVQMKRKERSLCLMFIGLVSFFIFFSETPAQTGTVELPQTGQTTCYKANGTTEACLGTDQDGDFLAGVSWPNPRFTIDSSLQCIKDNLTGLTWARDISAFAGIWPTSVVNYPTIYFACGMNDWRIPNVSELQGLVHFGQPDSATWLYSQGFIFPISTTLPYWTSTSSADNPTINAWVVDMVGGIVFPDNKGSTHFLWPVRGTSNTSVNIPPGQIAETGQITVYATYDDAYFATTPTLNVGVPWPIPRFTASGDCVTDNLTGLMWSRDANLDGLKSWDNASAFTNDITICGYSDWRLPNSKEIFSLIDRSQYGPALPAGHPFAGVQSVLDDLYWTSTTYAFNTLGAWTVDLFRGGLNPHIKTDTAFMWPVRGGQTRPYILEVEKLGTGQGKVAAPELTCVGKFCTGEYSSYEVVTVTATANSGSVFTGWGGDACSGITVTVCAIIMTADTTATATFLPEYKISVDPKSLNFKNLKKDVPSDFLTVTVTNVGVADLVLSPPVIAGDFPSVFSQTNDCPAALSSNAFCTITVTATSPDYDKKTAELQIVSNDPKKPTTIVKLKAKAKPPKIAKKPSSLNFGKVTQPGSLDKALTITNKGVTDLVIGTITISGDNPGDFSIILPDACSGSTLATDASCTLTLRFTPSVSDKRSAVLNIPSNDPKKQPALTVKLKGTGQ